MNGRLKVRELLLACAVVSFMGYDSITSLLVFDSLQTFDYESSAVLRMAFSLGGVTGFLAIKSFFSGVCFALAYLLTDRHAGLLNNKISAGMLMGAVACGLIVGTSNLMSLQYGYTLSLFGLPVNIIAIVAIVVPPLLLLVLPVRMDWLA